MPSPGATRTSRNVLTELSPGDGGSLRWCAGGEAQCVVQVGQRPSVLDVVWTQLGGPSKVPSLSEVAMGLQQHGEPKVGIGLAAVTIHGSGVVAQRVRRARRGRRPWQHRGPVGFGQPRFDGASRRWAMHGPVRDPVVPL